MRKPRVLHLCLGEGWGLVSYCGRGLKRVVWGTNDTEKFRSIYLNRPSDCCCVCVAAGIKAKVI